MDLQSANRLLAAGQDMSREQMQDVMRLVMNGEATPAQIGAFLTALMIKGETVDEIVGAANIIREMAAHVTTRADKVVDTVGTGGDDAKLFNVSTACALATCAAGASVAKHGNRAATGNSGSADVLEEAGVNIAITPAQVGECIDATGIGFMFAPTHHAATRHAIGPRREIGIRTIFNLLGPLTNPANAKYQLVGVFDQKWVEPIARVFGELGSVHTVVVCSDDGIDEISLAEGTAVAEYRNGEVTTCHLFPEDVGISRQSMAPLIVSDSVHSLSLIKQALSGENGAPFDMVALNAGATLYAADLADSIQSGVALAKEVLVSGKALDKLTELATFTDGFRGTD